MPLQIDPDSQVPIYLQIVQDIKHKVAAGILKPGEHLPTVRELAADLRVNPNTVARAYDQLDKDRVITTQQGRGTYVRERPDQDHLSRMREEHLRSMMETVVARALSMGYTVNQVQEAFGEQLDSWKQAQKSGAGKEPTNQPASKE